MTVSNVKKKKTNKKNNQNKTLKLILLVMTTLLPHAKLSMQVQLPLRSHPRRKSVAGHSKEPDIDPNDGGKKEKHLFQSVWIVN